MSFSRVRAASSRANHVSCSRRRRTLLAGTIALLFAQSPAAGRADQVDAALAEVRETKRDLFDPATSSVLGKLPGPGELAAAQPSRRFAPRSPEACAVDFDDEARARLARDYATCTFIYRDRQQIPMFPMGITGAYLFDLYGRTELVVLMVEANSPADGRLEPYDIIIGANGRMFDNPVDSRPALGAALAESQTPELGGKLTLQVVRGGVPFNVVVDLGDTEPYAPTWPLGCAKSRRIAAAALQCVKDHANVEGRDGLWTTLFLLASGDQEAMEMARRRVYQSARIGEHPSHGANWTWLICYPLIEKCEYYLLTGDTTVLSSVQHDVDELERRQFDSGGWGNRLPPGYGEVNQVGYSALISLLLARECGATVDDGKLALAIRYFGKFCGVGSPYGDNIPPMLGGGGHNGIDALNAVLFNLLGEKELAQRTARLVCYSWPLCEKGHSESTFGFAWSPIGAALATKEEYHMYMNNMLWYYELMRTRDDAFAFSGATGFGFPRETTALQALFLFQEEPRLRILGAAESPFSQPVPGALAEAVSLFHKRDFAAARIEAQKLAQATDREVSSKAERLVRIVDFNAANLDFTLASVREHVDAGDRETATAQIDALERLLGGPTRDSTALRAARPSPEAVVRQKPALTSLLTRENKDQAMKLRRPETPAMLWRTLLPFEGRDTQRTRRNWFGGVLESETTTRTFEVDEVRGEWLRVLLKNEDGGEIFLNGQRLAVVQDGSSKRFSQLTPSARPDKANAYILWPISLGALRQGTNTLTFRPPANSGSPVNISLEIGPYIPDHLNVTESLAGHWRFEENEPGIHESKKKFSSPAYALGRVEACQGVDGAALLLHGNPKDSRRGDQGVLMIPKLQDPADSDGNMASMTVSLWVKNAGETGSVTLDHTARNADGKPEAGWRLTVGRKYNTDNLSASLEAVSGGTSAAIDAKMEMKPAAKGFYHLVIRHDAETKLLSIFCNGVKLAERKLAGQALLPVDCRALVSTSENSSFCVDDLAEWKRALPDTEIVKIFTQAGVQPGKTQPVGIVGRRVLDKVRARSLEGLANHWAFDEGQGGVANDTLNPQSPAFILSRPEWCSAPEGGIRSLRLMPNSGTRPGDILFAHLADPRDDGILGAMSISMRVKCPAGGELNLRHAGRNAQGQIESGWNLQLRRSLQQPDVTAAAFQAMDGEGNPLALQSGFAGGETCNRWVVVCDAAARILAVYCNGMKIGEAPLPESGLVPFAGPMTLATGGSVPVEIDELAIWHRPLSWEEVVCLEHAPAIAGQEELARIEKPRTAEIPELPPLGTGIRQRWLFDEKEGLITRGNGGAGQAGLICSRAHWVPGKSGNALRLADAATVLMPEYRDAVDDLGNPGSMTVSFWVDSGPAEPARLTFSRKKRLPGETAARGWELVVETKPKTAGRNEKLTLLLTGADGKSATVSASTETAADGFSNWMLAFDRKTSAVSIYCNGALVQTGRFPETAFAALPPGAVFRAEGRDHVCLDEWTVWDRALSAYEVAGLVHGHFELPSAAAPASGADPALDGLARGLADHWTFDECEDGWLRNAVDPGNAAHGVGTAELEEGHFGSRIRLHSKQGLGALGDGMFLVPDLRDPVAGDGTLGDMTVAFWVGIPPRSRGSLTLDHATMDDKLVAAGWKLDIAPFNPFAKDGQRASARFQAVTKEGEPFEASAQFPEDDFLAHWALVYDKAGNRVAIYRNGVAVAEEGVPVAGLIPAAGTLSGYAPVGNSHVYVDELARWNRALSGDELTAIARAGVRPPAGAVARTEPTRSAILEGLRDYWRFDEGTGNRTHDALRPGSTAVLKGSAGWTDGFAGRALQLAAADQEAGLLAAALVFRQFQPPAAGAAPSSASLSMRLGWREGNNAWLVMGRVSTDGRGRLLEGWRLKIGGGRRNQNDKWVEFEGRAAGRDPFKLVTLVPTPERFGNLALVYDHEEETVSLYWNGVSLGAQSVAGLDFDLAALYPDVNITGNDGSVILDELALWTRALPHRDVLNLAADHPLCSDQTLAKLRQRVDEQPQPQPLPLEDEQPQPPPLPLEDKQPRPPPLPLVDEQPRPPPLPLEEGLTSRWRFDEGDQRQVRDDVQDAVANLDGDVEWVDGRKGRAIRFSDGAARGENARSGYVLLPYRGDRARVVAPRPEMDSISVSLWMKASRLENSVLLLDQYFAAGGVDAGWEMLIETRPDGNRDAATRTVVLQAVAHDDSSVVARSQASVETDEFEHWVWSYDQARRTITFYRNAEKIGESRVPKGGLLPYVGDINLGVGNGDPVTVDEVLVWRRALSHHDVAALYGGEIILGPAADKPVAPIAAEDN